MSKDGTSRIEREPPSNWIPHAAERKSGVRRLNPPTNSPEAGDYSDNETDFMRAMDAYKTSRHRPFPTCVEVLAVLESLGWRRTEAAAELPTFVPGKGW